MKEKVKMKITHVFLDGHKEYDITNHMIGREATEYYDLLKRINKK